MATGCREHGGTGEVGPEQMSWNPGWYECCNEGGELKMLLRQTSPSREQIHNVLPELVDPGQCAKIRAFSRRAADKADRNGPR